MDESKWQPCFSDVQIKDVVTEVIQQNPDLIFAFKPKYVSANDWEMAISLKPALFAKCKEKTPHLCILAISLDGFNIEYVDPVEHSETFYMNLCKAAIQQNPKAIVAIPKEFRTRELRAMAYALDPELLINEKKLTESMITSILEHNPSLIQYVVDPTDDMIIKALSMDPRVIVYFKSISPTVKQYFEEYYPQYASMLIHE